MQHANVFWSSCQVCVQCASKAHVGVPTYLSPSCFFAIILVRLSIKLKTETDRAELKCPFQDPPSGMMYKRSKEGEKRKRRVVLCMLWEWPYHTGWWRRRERTMLQATFHVPCLKSGTWRRLNSLRMRLFDNWSQINMSNDCSTVSVIKHRKMLWICNPTG